MFILIIGGKGNLGTELSILLAKKRISHISVDRDYFDILNEIRVNSFLKANREITHVVNCAAFTDVVGAEKESSLADKVNAEAVGILASACKRHGKSLLHFSTDYVYGGFLPNQMQDENTPIEPLNHYGRTKAQGDKNIMSLLSDYKILRIQSLYSKFGPNFLFKVNQFIEKNGSSNVVDDQFMSPCSTLFISETVLILLQKWSEVKTGVYNLTHDNYCSPYEFAKYYFAMTETKGKGIRKMSYKNMNFGVVRPNNSLMDCTKIKTALSLKGLDTWEKDLETYRNIYGDIHRN